jgi:hypothetical protein
MEPGWNNLADIAKIDEYLEEGIIHIPSMIWLGKYKVAFGYRLRGGHFCDIDVSSELEICCGSEPEDYNIMLHMVKTIIEANIKANLPPLDNVPVMSSIKPYPNDKHFCSYIRNLYEDAKTFLTENH